MACSILDECSCIYHSDRSLYLKRRNKNYNMDRYSADNLYAARCCSISNLHWKKPAYSDIETGFHCKREPCFENVYNCLASSQILPETILQRNVYYNCY